MATFTDIRNEILSEMEEGGVFDDRGPEYRHRIAASLAHNMFKLKTVRTKYDHRLDYHELRTLGEIGEQVAGYFKIHVYDDLGLLAAIREREE